MTKKRDLKAKVRERMSATGENYTTAQRRLAEALNQLRERKIADLFPSVLPGGLSPEALKAAELATRAPVGVLYLTDRLLHYPTPEPLTQRPPVMFLNCQTTLGATLPPARAGGHCYQEDPAPLPDNRWMIRQQGFDRGPEEFKNKVQGTFNPTKKESGDE